MVNSLPILKEMGYNSLLTYADLRFGAGAAYERVGFELIGSTEHSYAYTDGVRRFNRFKFRAQPDRSEKDVATVAGVHRVYGPGSNIYEMAI